MTRSMIIALLVGGCSPQPVSEDGAGTNAPAPRPPASADGWVVREGGAEIAFAAAGQVAISLTCPRGSDRLVVTVPAFRRIGSEERLSLGGDEAIITLVADTHAEKAGGVTASGPQPAEIKALLFTPLTASYGSQTSGPHPAVPSEVQRRFVQACSDSATAARTAAAQPTASTHPCLVEDGKLVRLPAMRALGTEPFWNARTHGRCVTYSTPEDQSGTRIWTKIGTGPMGPIWAGSYRGKPFILRVQPAVGCSDGMSDRKYDWEASLTVGGDERKGCAESLK